MSAAKVLPCRAAFRAHFAAAAADFSTPRPSKYRRASTAGDVASSCSAAWRIHFVPPRAGFARRPGGPRGRGRRTERAEPEAAVAVGREGGFHSPIKYIIGLALLR